MNFYILPLGCTGGPYEDNLSGYLFGTDSEEGWLALDAGSLLGGMAKAYVQGHLPAEPKEFLVKHVKAYLVSHAHLDHIVGLVINSQIDSKKRIYALDETIDHLRDYIFNGAIWPNYGSEGKNPLQIYQYYRMKPGEKEEILGTSFSVTSFQLNHAEPHYSTAFLLEAFGNYVLYFGDTAGDQECKIKRLQPIWQTIAPLVLQGKMKAMLLECSYGHAHKKSLFGHLDAHMMMSELRELGKLCSNLQGIKVIVTHRKQMNEDSLSFIEKEIASLNDLGITFIFPVQGQKIII